MSINNEIVDEVFNVKLIELKDNKLYGKTGDLDILIDNEVSLIIKDNDYSIYYLKNDTLYYYNFYQGCKKIMKYSEWKFNNKNMIFVFD